MFLLVNTKLTLVFYRRPRRVRWYPTSIQRTFLQPEPTGRRWQLEPPRQQEATPGIDAFTLSKQTLQAPASAPPSPSRGPRVHQRRSRKELSLFDPLSSPSSVRYRPTYALSQHTNFFWTFTMHCTGKQSHNNLTGLPNSDPPMVQWSGSSYILIFNGCGAILGILFWNLHFRE